VGRGEDIMSEYFMDFYGFMDIRISVPVKTEDIYNRYNAMKNSKKLTAYLTPILMGYEEGELVYRQDLASETNTEENQPISGDLVSKLLEQLEEQNQSIRMILKLVSGLTDVIPKINALEMVIQDSSTDTYNALQLLGEIKEAVSNTNISFVAASKEDISLDTLYKQDDKQEPRFAIEQNNEEDQAEDKAIAERSERRRIAMKALGERT
jgi:tRNA uridine 5-carbamoylmethylation protein Kti12